MKSTLNELIENINANLVDIIGSTVTSKLDVCKTVREIIKENEFYKMLEENGLNDVLVFKDDVENMPFIFIHASGNNNLKKIIEILIKINYYDETDYSKGGILDIVQCIPIDMGEKIKNIPLNQVVLALKLKNIVSKKNDIILKEKNINEKIIVLQKDLENLRKEYTEYDENEKDINNQLNALTKN